MIHPIEPLVDYALGLLEPQEVVQLEAHLSSCQDCRAEVVRLRATLLSLTEELEPVAPPSGSWDRVRSRIHQPRRSVLPTWALPAVAAVLLMVTSALGVAWWRNQSALNAMLEGQALVKQWMTNPKVRLVPLTQKTGRVMGYVLLQPDGRGLVVMPEAAPKGQSYQAWGLFEHSRSASAASLGVSNGAIFEVELHPYPWFWLSLEPLGGSKVPTKGIGWSKVVGGSGA